MVSNFPYGEPFDEPEEHANEASDELKKFLQTGYGATESDKIEHNTGGYRSEQHKEEVALFKAMADQQVMETEAFANQVHTYMMTLARYGWPLQVVTQLAQQWQQMEMVTRQNLLMLERKIEEGG